MIYQSTSSLSLVIFWRLFQIRYEKYPDTEFRLKQNNRQFTFRAAAFLFPVYGGLPISSWYVLLLLSTCLHQRTTIHIQDPVLRMCVRSTDVIMMFSTFSSHPTRKMIQTCWIVFYSITGDINRIIPLDIYTETFKTEYGCFRKYKNINTPWWHYALWYRLYDKTQKSLVCFTVIFLYI